MIDTRHFFGTFLSEKCGTVLVESFSNVTASVGVVITDEPDTAGSDHRQQWTIRIDEGVLLEVTQDKDECDVYYTMTPATLEKMVKREITPQRAFFTEEVTVDGDLLMGMKIAALLNSFFEQYPYTIN